MTANHLIHPKTTFTVAPGSDLEDASTQACVSALKLGHPVEFVFNENRRWLVDPQSLVAQVAEVFGDAPRQAATGAPQGDDGDRPAWVRQPGFIVVSSYLSCPTWFNVEHLAKEFAEKQAVVHPEDRFYVAKSEGFYSGPSARECGQ